MTTFYITASDQSVTSTRPDLTGKVLLPVALPEGVPLAMLVPQISSLQRTIDGLGEGVATIVIQITIG